MAVRAAREELEETERFSKLLELFLGNYVDAGSRNEWPRSFNITVLCKVIDRKSTDQKRTSLCPLTVHWEALWGTRGRRYSSGRTTAGRCQLLCAPEWSSQVLHWSVRECCCFPTVPCCWASYGFDPFPVAAGKAPAEKASNESKESTGTEKVETKPVPL